jgi:hypothetical protein
VPQHSKGLLKTLILGFALLDLGAQALGQAAGTDMFIADRNGYSAGAREAAGYKEILRLMGP